MVEEFPQQQPNKFEGFDSKAKKDIEDILEEMIKSYDDKKLYHPNALQYWSTRLEILSEGNEAAIDKKEWTQEKRLAVVAIIAKEISELNSKGDKPTLNQLQDWQERLYALLLRPDEILDLNPDSVIGGKHFTEERKIIEKKKQ